MPNDNDNEGPGLGLGDLNDIFNDDPFSNAGGESPTGNHRLVISDNALSWSSTDLCFTLFSSHSQS